MPLVFPQFGHPKKEMAQHGFARTSEWDLTDTVVDEDLVRAVFHLTDSETTRQVWPHRFLLSYTLSLTGKALTTSLRIQNVGPEPFEAQALLHTYLRLGAVDEAGVHGLGKHVFIDKVDPSPEGADLPVDGRDVATIEKVGGGALARVCAVRVVSTSVESGRLVLIQSPYMSPRIHTQQPPMFPGD